MLLSNGTVVGMGENRSGQIGGTPTVNVMHPPRRILLPGKAVQISAWGDTSYALLEDGTVWAWGRGYSGELGREVEQRDRFARLRSPCPDCAV